MNGLEAVAITQLLAHFGIHKLKLSGLEHGSQPRARAVGLRPKDILLGRLIVVVLFRCIIPVIPSTMNVL